MHMINALVGEKIPAGEARKQINLVVLECNVKGTDLARGLNMNDAQLNRMRHKKTGFYRAETLRPIARVQAILELAEKILTKVGVRKWLTTPNPRLDDLPPILCLRTDKEAEKVKSLLVALGHGFPA